VQAVEHHPSSKKFPSTRSPETATRSATRTRLPAIGAPSAPTQHAFDAAKTLDAQQQVTRTDRHVESPTWR
jgi:hypothetical protein